jgi:hypothetical protein
MIRKLPAPVCRAFLACSHIDGDVITPLHNFTWFVNPGHPRRINLPFFVRLRDGHDSYTIAVHLQDQNGDIICRETATDPWCPVSPLEIFDLTLNLDAVFPGVGDYVLVLTANGEEISRDPLFARLPQTTADS